jgi:hypothetical protein
VGRIRLDAVSSDSRTLAINCPFWTLGVDDALVTNQLLGTLRAFVFEAPSPIILTLLATAVTWSNVLSNRGAMTPDESRRLLEEADRHILALKAVIDKLAIKGEDQPLCVIASILSRLAFRARPLGQEGNEMTSEEVEAVVPSARGSSADFSSGA